LSLYPQHFVLGYFHFVPTGQNKQKQQCLQKKANPNIRQLLDSLGCRYWLLTTGYFCTVVRKLIRKSKVLMSENLFQSSLHDKHVAAEASMGDVAGWRMPLSYRGVLDEVRQVRATAGVMDVSHIGRIRIRGDGALAVLEYACTHDVARQDDNTATPSLLVNESGGIIDAVTLLRLEEHWLMLCSPINRLKVLEHLTILADAMDAKVDDQTTKTTMIEVAGPAAVNALDHVLPEKASAMAGNGAKSGSFMIAHYTVARAAGLGVWAINVAISNLFAGQAWRFITAKAGDNCIAPVGLSARDVLRIEAGQPAYGWELNETIDPYTAGLDGRVDFGHTFIGIDALRKLAAGTPARKRAGLVLAPSSAGLHGDNIPRQGDAVRAGDREIGTITSATYSPTLDRIIALAYVAADIADTDQPVTIDRAGSPLEAKTTSLPFVPLAVS